MKVKMKVKVTIWHRLVFSSFVQALQEGQGSGMPSCQKPSGRELSQIADCQKEKIKFARKTFQDFLMLSIATFFSSVDFCLLFILSFCLFLSFFILID